MLGLDEYFLSEWMNEYMLNARRDNAPVQTFFMSL